MNRIQLFEYYLKIIYLYHKMNIKDLESNPVIKKIVEDIITDETFRRKCEINFKQIFADGKIDKDDIPLMVNLILNVYQNYTKIRVQNVDLKPVFMLLLSKLINQFKGESNLDEQLILLLVEPQVDLLLMSINVSKCPSSCCGSRPEKEENVVNKLKVNRVDKGNTK